MKDKSALIIRGQKYSHPIRYSIIRAEQLLLYYSGVHLGINLRGGGLLPQGNHNFHTELR